MSKSLRVTGFPIIYAFRSKSPPDFNLSILSSLTPCSAWVKGFVSVPVDRRVRISPQATRCEMIIVTKLLGWSQCRSLVRERNRSPSFTPRGFELNLAHATSAQGFIAVLTSPRWRHAAPFRASPLPVSPLGTCVIGYPSLSMSAFNWSRYIGRAS